MQNLKIVEMNEHYGIAQKANIKKKCRDCPEEIVGSKQKKVCFKCRQIKNKERANFKKTKNAKNKQIKRNKNIS